MLVTKSKTNVEKYLAIFCGENVGRPTRLGVFEKRRGGFVDYWLEDDLPLLGIDVDDHSDAVNIQILLSNKIGEEKSHFTHTVRGVREVKFILAFDGQSNGLEIADYEGKTTILRFEWDD